MNYQFPKKVEELLFELIRKGIRLNKPTRTIYVDWIEFTINRTDDKEEPSDYFRINLQPYGIYLLLLQYRKKELIKFWKELTKALKLVEIYFDELVHEILKSEPIEVTDGIIESGYIGKYSKNKQYLTPLKY